MTGKRVAPDAEEMAPPVYEQGNNIGPNISEALDVEHLDADLFRSAQQLWKPFRARGDESIPIYYHVSRLRDGGSYVTRLVEAKQRGKCIFVLFTSYAKPEPDRPTFAIPLPASITASSSSSSSSEGSNSTSSGTNPEDSRPASSPSQAPPASSSNPPSGPYTPSSSGVIPGGISIDSRFSKERTTDGKVQGLIPYQKAELTEERYIRVLNELESVLPETIKEGLRAWIKDRRESAIEIRDALPGMFDENGFPTPGYEQAFWLRAKTPVAGGEDAQKAALSYASDMNLLGTVSKALGNSRKIQMMASLDHSMWFYEPFDLNKPMLFFMQTQVSSNGRGLAMGRFYSESGQLLAIVSQEGVVRAKAPRKNDTKTSKL